MDRLLTAKWLTPAKWVLCLLLLLWITHSVAIVFWRLIPEPELKPAEVTETSPFATPANPAYSPPSVNIDQLKTLALFGNIEKSANELATKAPTVQEKVEETRLQLKLMGSFANTTQQGAYAIIANGNKQSLYRVNEEIDGLSGVKLIAVYTEKVVLDNRGKQEALYMYPEGEAISSPAPSPKARGAQPTAARDPVRSIASLDGKQRLEKISDVIRFTRKTSAGKMIGFRVLPGRNRAAFEQTGLQLNDVVTSIDGQPLDNLRAANKIYQEKRNAVQASLSVLRGDEQLTIDIDLNNINVNNNDG